MMTNTVINKAGKATKESIKKIVADKNVKFIRLQFTDILGTIKNVEIPVSQLDKALDNMQKVLEAPAEARPSLIKVSMDIEKEINDLRNEYKMDNATQVKAGAYPYPISVTYMDIISECEKIGDYIVNVVEQYQETNKK